MLRRYYERVMNLLSSILLGILQGLTEFLPVSSSGHLVLAQYFFGLKASNDIVLEVFLHLGTLVAVLIYYRKTLWELARSLFVFNGTVDNSANRHNRTLVLYLVLATLATGLVYYLFGDLFESFFAKPLLVALMLAVTGFIVFASDFMKTNSIPASEMGVVRSVIVGIIQGIAIIPGISRSGSTIAGALFTGVKRQDAAKFSFLLSIPAIVAANLANLSELTQLTGSKLVNYTSGAVAACLVAYLVISFLMRLIQTARLKYFAYYCWLVALFSVVYILSDKV